MNWRTLPALLLLIAPGKAFSAAFPALPPPASELCRQAIDKAERTYGIPLHLLAAVARVESGRRDPESGKLSPWPWTINKDGQGSFYDVKAQALAAAEAMQPRVRTSIDVGCMQISLTHHPDAFATLDQAFDPVANADYGARFLLQLYGKTQSWPKAVGLYHSATPDLGNDYQAKVYAVWPEEQKLATTTLAAVPSLAAPSLNAGWARSPFARIAPQSPPHVIPAANGANGAGIVGRTLDSYRSMPVRLASRLP